MPSSKWNVEPVHLCRKPLPPDKQNLYEFDALANASLVGAIKQLAFVANASVSIFDELAAQCMEIHKRTTSLTKRISSCKNIVVKLDAKKEKIPTSNLDIEMAITRHFKSSKPITKNIITVESRPPYVVESYEKASLTPVHAIRDLDTLRRDGRTGTRYFVCQPFFKDGLKRDNNLDIELEKPTYLSGAARPPTEAIVASAKSPPCKSEIRLDKHRKPGDNEQSASTGKSRSKARPPAAAAGLDTSSDECEATNSSSATIRDEAEDTYRLPTPREQMEVLAKEYSASYVPIDVTGVTFQRMSSFRKPLLHNTPIKRVKPKSSTCKHSKAHRRNTMSSASADRAQQQGDNATRRRRRLSDGSIASRCDNGVQTEATEESIYSSGRILDVNSRSNTCVKTRCESPSEDRKAKVHRRSLYDNVTPGSSSAEPPVEQHHHRHSSTIKSNGSSGKKNHHQVSNSNKSASTMTSLSAAAVRLREVSASKHHPGHDDGRSSSGNWSASSSTHAGSVDSDPASTPTASSSQASRATNYNDQDQLSRSNSQRSLGKDSVLSESMVVHHPDTDCASSLQECTFTNGYQSDTSMMSTSTAKGSHQSALPSCNTSFSSEVRIRTNPGLATQKGSVKYANRDSESWLKYFDAESSDATMTPTETTLSDTETVTQSQVVSGSPSVTGSRRPSATESFSASPTVVMDDEVESVHSMDTDGYYTSMHTDSGLFRGRPVKLLMTPNSSFRLKGKRSSISSTGTVGDISISSVLSRELSLTEPPSATRQKRPPPPPPPRKTNSGKGGGSPPSAKSTMTTTPRSERSFAGSDISRSHSPSPGLASATSESEAGSDGRKRRQRKTAIDASRYPSMCAISSSDDSSSDGSSPSSKTGSMRGFRIRDIFSSGPLQALSRSISKSRDNMMDKKSKDHQQEKTSRREDQGQSSQPSQSSNKAGKRGPLMPFNMYGSEDGSPTKPVIRARPTPSRSQQITQRLISPFACKQPIVPATNGEANNGGSIAQRTSSSSGRGPPPAVPLKTNQFNKSLLAVRPSVVVAAFTSSQSSTEDNHARTVAKGKESQVENEDQEQTNKKLVYNSDSLLARRHEHDSHLANYSTQVPRQALEKPVPPKRDAMSSPFATRGKLANPFISPVMAKRRDAEDAAQIISEIISETTLPRDVDFNDDKETDYEREIEMITDEIAKSHHKVKTISGTINNNNLVMSPTRDYKLSQLTPPRMTSTPLSPPAPKSCPTSPALTPSPKKSTMSTDELLALIHTSKKKLNLKLDFDSVQDGPQNQQPPRPRSLTPNSFNGPSYAPGGQKFSSALNRRSWAGSDPATAAKKELAADRLGPPKPTTINDFKRLLSQARPQTSPEQRRSAAEMLQLAKTSPIKSQSSPMQPAFDAVRSVASSLVNLSRGNGAKVSPLLAPVSVQSAKTRVINGRIYRTPYRLEKMYPPIVEGSEENLAKSSERLNSLRKSGDFSASKLSQPPQRPLLKSSEGNSTWV